MRWLFKSHRGDATVEHDGSGSFGHAALRLVIPARGERKPYLVMGGILDGKHFRHQIEMDSDAEFVLEVRFDE